MIKVLKKKLVPFRSYIVYRYYNFLAASAKDKFPLDPESNFVVTVASYPKRIHLVPAVFESLARQEKKARRAYLVLSEEDFPNKTLPHAIQKLVHRGVEVVWTVNNPYAVKKLMPVLGLDPDCAVCTFDDDTLYEKTVTTRLYQVAENNKGSIVGFWGKSLYRRGNDLSMWYREEVSFSDSLTGDQVYLLGGGGVWYPPGSLHPRVTNIDAVHELVPGRGSDIWFWAAAHAVGSVHTWISTKGLPRMWIPIPQNEITKPKEQPGADILEERFQQCIDYFGIREKLIRDFPDRS